MRPILSALFLGTLLLVLSGCSQKTLHLYTLDTASAAPKVTPRFETLRVDYPQGIENGMSDRIYFRRSDLSQSYYSQSQWSHTLNRILMANLLETLRRSGIAHHVIDYASQADAGYELESTVYRFEQIVEGEHSYAEISIGLRLLRSDTKKLIAQKIFTARVPCPTTDARGFVEAANNALEKLGAEMVHWLARQ
ncbi:ABC-type transport auxiliary lipoprotein family protein [Nitratifractor sp.]